MGKVCRNGNCVPTSQTDAGPGVSTGTAGAGVGGSRGGNHGMGGRGGSTAGGSGGGAGTAGTGDCAACQTGQTCMNGNCGDIKCTAGATNPPASALITDFSNFVPTSTGTGEYTFGGGTAGHIQGGNVHFQNPASSPGTYTLGTNQLTYSATISAASSTGADATPYSGFVLYFDGPACTNAMSFSGVSFTISSSTTGSCSLVFSFVDSEHTLPSGDIDRGSASGNAYPPQIALLAGSPKMIPFSTTPNNVGSPPIAIDSTKLIGVQWEFTNGYMAASSCTGTVTIGDVSFY